MRDETYFGRMIGGIEKNSCDAALSRPPTALNVAHNALEEARQLAFRVDAMIDRLCGSVPEPCGESGGKLGGSMSILGGLRENADHTVDVLRNTQSRLNRLDQELS